MAAPAPEQDEGTATVSVAGRRHSPPSQFPWPPVLFLAAILAGWLLQRTWPLGWPGLDDLPAQIIGRAFIVGGFAIAIWALLAMVRANAEFRPHAEATVLVTSGPFRRFRNPMYLGYALILLGLADSSKNLWIAMITPLFGLAVTWLAIIPEERHLEEKFGDDYREYRSSARRWI